MANRRMFSLDVVDTDMFLSMPASSQSLYFHLGMRADDDGFVSSPRKITAMVNCGADDLNLLIAKGFLIPFDDGVVVITHWKQNNYVKSDRYKETLYKADKAMLCLEDGVYKVSPECPRIGTDMEPKWNQLGTNLEPEWNQNGTKMETQVRDRDRDSIGYIKESKEKRPPDCLHLFENLSPSYDLSEDLLNKTHTWIQYKVERKEPYKEQGMKSLLSQIQKHAKEYGDSAVINLIDECMANGWKGIIWDRLKKEPNKFDNFSQPETDYDALMLEKVRQRMG